MDPPDGSSVRALSLNDSDGYVEGEIMILLVKKLSQSNSVHICCLDMCIAGEEMKLQFYLDVPVATLTCKSMNNFRYRKHSRATISVITV